MASTNTLSAGGLALWQKVRAIFPSAVLTSAGRTASHNSTIPGASSKSQHIGGNAFDFQVPGYDPLDVQKILIASGVPFGQSIAEYGLGMGPRNHLSVGTKGQLMTATDGKYKTTGFTGANFSDAIGSTLRATLPQSVQDFLGGTLADGLTAPGDALDKAVESVTPAFESWFQRGALVIFALIFIAAAVFAFKGGDAINMVKAGR